MRDLAFAGFDGVELTLGGRTWVLPDLAPRQLRKVLPAMAALASVKEPQDFDEARIERLFDAFYHALTRNYPDLSREEFLDLPIGLKQLVAAVPALARAAGIEPREDAAPGEARGAAADSTHSSIH